MKKLILLCFAVVMTATIATAQQGNIIEHHVVAGETLYSLSKQYKVPIDLIIKSNTDVLADGMRVGDILRIPSTEATQQSTEAKKPNNHTVTQTQAQAIDNPVRTNRRKQAKEHSAMVNVALMMPFVVGDKENKSFMEFYYGVVVALQKLKEHGISVELDVINTEKSQDAVERIINSGRLDNADLIIGPVYDDTFDVMAQFAEQREIPIISPLAAVNADNPFVIQIAPSHQQKLNKIREVIGNDKNILLIRPIDQLDKEFEEELAEVLPRNGVTKLDYLKSTDIREVENKLTTDRDNIIIVASSNENKVEEIMARMSSMHNSMSARGLTTPAITVLGNSKWNKFNHIEKNLYFKLNVTYVANYHADRGDSTVLNFDRDYIKMFQSLPTPYSYRGYDIASLFISNYVGDRDNMLLNLDNNTYKVLQVPYRFVQRHRSGKLENIRWIAVKYNQNYEITLL